MNPLPQEHVGRSVVPDSEAQDAPVVYPAEACAAPSTCWASGFSFSAHKFLHFTVISGSCPRPQLSQPRCGWWGASFPSYYSLTPNSHTRECTLSWPNCPSVRFSAIHQPPPPTFLLPPVGGVPSQTPSYNHPPDSSPSWAAGGLIPSSPHIHPQFPHPWQAGIGPLVSLDII